MQDYLKQHSFLEESAKLYQSLEEKFQHIEPIKLPSENECKKLIKDGLPLIQHEDLQQLIIRSVLKFMPETSSALIENLIKQNNDEVHNFCKKNNLNEVLIRMTAWIIINRLIPKELPEYWEDWKKNYCPVCGRRPVLAQLKKEMEGRARYLYCDGCHTMWRYNRVGCVYCGNEELKHMHILESESEPQIRLDVCDECHCYLKTYNEDGQEDIYLKDWMTLHFDILAEEQELKKIGSIMLE